MTTTVTDIFRADLNEDARKMEVDYSSACDEKIPMFKDMASKGKFIEAIDGLLSLEKQTRTVSFYSRLLSQQYSLVFYN